MSSASKLRELATALLDAFKDLSPDLVSLRASNCAHIFAPASVPLPPLQTNDEFTQHMSNLRQILSGFPVTLKEMHVNEAGRQVTVWANGKPTFREEVKSEPKDEWEYTGEYIFIIDFDEEGKIVRILEFLDSLATQRLFGLMAKAKKNLEEKSKA